MATFKKRESGFWQVVIRRKGQPQQSKSFERLEDGERWARQIESTIDKGAFISPWEAQNTTFAELGQRFSTDFAPYHYRCKNWQHMLARLVERLGQYSLVAITPAIVAGYRDARLKDPDPRYTKSRKPPCISSSTVKKELDLLSKVLDVAQKEFSINLPQGNSTKNIRKPKQGKGRDRRLDSDEWAALMAECRKSQNPYLYNAVELSVETAMRQGELLQLEWKNIHLERRVALLLDTDKIKNGEARAVPLTSRAIEILKSLPRQIKDRRLFPVQKMTLYQAFIRACKRAGIEDFTWHDIRHEAISRLAERGDLTLMDMAGVSGHKTLQMLRRYTHLNAEVLARKLG